MKRALLPILLTFPLLHIGGCSSEDAPVQLPGTAGTGSPGAAGTAPAGGTNGTAGSGTDPGTSGTGGSGTSGSDTGGSGGGATGGGGSGTAGTGGAAPTPVSVGKLDGMLIMTPCDGTPTTDDCVSSGWIYEGKSTACSAGGRLEGTVDFPITGGEMGKRYLATMHFYGIMEPKNYGNRVTREAGTQRPNASVNPSTPEGFATAEPNVSVDVTTYNNYEVITFDEKGAKLKQYFINSDLGEGHYTFAVNYERKIEIVAGGKVQVHILDSNCRMIKNCLGGPPCSDQKARRIDVSAAMPQPTALMQPGMGRPADQSGQWFLIDVKDVVAKP